MSDLNWKLSIRSFSLNLDDPKPGVASHNLIMDLEKHEKLLDDILNPHDDRADEILGDMGLFSLPSREQVHSEIEAKLLLPKNKFPRHWLPTYQV